MKRAAAFLGLITVGVLGLGVAAAAAGPPQQIVTMPIDETSVLAECDGFQVLDHNVGELTVTVSFGSDGKVASFVTDTRGRHELTNSVTGFSVDSPYHRKFKRDVGADRTQIVGPSYVVTVPGHGAVLFDTGIIRFDEGRVMHGPHYTMTGEAAQRLCPAFA